MIMRNGKGQKGRIHLEVNLPTPFTVSIPLEGRVLLRPMFDCVPLFRPRQSVALQMRPVFQSDGWAGFIASDVSIPWRDALCRVRSNQPRQDIHLSLKWPIVRRHTETGPDRIHPHILPFGGIAFTVAKLGVPEGLLPDRVFIGPGPIP